MHSVLITGASGFVGENLAHRFAREAEIVLAYGNQRPRTEAERIFSVDLTVPDNFTSALGDIDVEAVIHTAAMVSPDQCEKNPHMAQAINVEGTREVALWAELS